MNIKICCICYGRKYSEKMAQYLLPSLGSPNNFGYHKEEVYFDIYTEPDNEFLREKVAEYSTWCNMNVEYFDINQFPGEVMPRMFLCQKDCIRRTPEDFYIHFTSPDCIFSDGSFHFAISKIKEGYEGVVIPQGAPRVLEGQPIPKNSYLEMGRYFLINMHPETSSHFTDSPTFYPDAQQIIKDCGDYLLFKTHLVQPFLISNKNKAEFTDIETDYMKGAVPDVSNVYFVKDSSEVMEISFTPYYGGWGENRYDEKKWEEKVAGMEEYSRSIYEKGYRVLL